MSGSYNDPVALIAVAQDCLGNGDVQKACIKAKRALNLFKGKSDFDGAGKALITLVGSYIAAGKLQDGKLTAEGMLAEFKKAGEQKQEVMAKICIAEVLFAMGKPESALSEAKEAAEIAQSLRDREAEGVALRTSIKVTLSAGDVDTALQMTFRAADLYRECKDAEGEAMELLSAAEILLSRAEYNDAFSTAKKAAKLFQSSGNVLGQASALETGARAAAVLGFVTKSTWRSGESGDGAIQLAASALKIYKSVGEFNGQMSSGNMLASLYLQVGDYEQAQHIGQLTVECCDKSGYSEQSGEARIAVSNALLQRVAARKDSLSPSMRSELLSKAVAIAGEAVAKQAEYSSSTAVQAARAKALYQYAQATHTQTKELGLKSTQEALAAVKVACETFKTQKDDVNEAPALLLLSEIALMQKDINTAAEAAERSQELYKEMVDRAGEKKATEQMWNLRGSSLWNQRMREQMSLEADKTAEAKDMKFLPGIAPGAQGLKDIKGGVVYILLDNMKARAAKNIGGKDKK